MKMETEKEMRVKLIRESYKKMFDAMEGLTNSEAICQLETAKLDILLNDGIVVLGGRSGYDTTNKKGRVTNQPLFDVVQANRKKIE